MARPSLACGRVCPSELCFGPPVDSGSTDVHAGALARKPFCIIFTYLVDRGRAALSLSLLARCMGRLNDTPIHRAAHLRDIGLAVRLSSFLILISCFYWEEVACICDCVPWGAWPLVACWSCWATTQGNILSKSGVCRLSCLVVVPLRVTGGQLGIVLSTCTGPPSDAVRTSPELCAVCASGALRYLNLYTYIQHRARRLHLQRSHTRAPCHSPPQLRRRRMPTNSVAAPITRRGEPGAFCWMPLAAQ